MTDATKQQVDENAPFEEIVSRLRAVVDNLEAGELPLEQSLAMFEHGIQLSRLGQRRLDEAERRVEELLSDDPRVLTRPIDED